MSTDATLVWFRLDLRLEDNPALQAARDRGGAVIPVFVWSPNEEGSWPPGAASRWWLHQSLAALDTALRACGVRLIIRRGPSLIALRQLAHDTKAGAVLWNRRYEPAAVARDATIKTALGADGGISTQCFSLYVPNKDKSANEIGTQRQWVLKARQT